MALEVMMPARLTKGLTLLNIKPKRMQKEFDI